MTARAVLLADGPSDEPLGRHVALIAQRHGLNLDVVVPDLRRLDPSPGRRVADRLESILKIDDDFALVIVHRDAEAQDPQARYDEVEHGVAAIRADLPALPIVPVRMTEAWLLVDEAAIRRVAGRPQSAVPLGLPPVADAESVADPKELLQEALSRASGATGRRLRRFKRDFPRQRRRLLEQVDHAGAVARLCAWQELEDRTRAVINALRDEEHRPGS